MIGKFSPPHPFFTGTHRLTAAYMTATGNAHLHILLLPFIYTTPSPLRSRKSFFEVSARRESSFSSVMLLEAILTFFREMTIGDVDGRDRDRSIEDLEKKEN